MIIYELHYIPVNSKQEYYNRYDKVYYNYHTAQLEKDKLMDTNNYRIIKIIPFRV